MGEARLVKELGFARGIAPEPRLLVSEWADRYRVLSGKASAYRGRWRTSRTPYLREIMDCLSPHSAIEKVVLMKGGQLGGTEALLNWLGSIVHSTPGPVLYVLPTVDVAKRVSKSRIAPMIEETPALRGLVSEARSRDSGNTVLVKEFPGGTMILTGANSAAGLSSMPIRFLELDEVDRFPGEIEGEGDPIALAEERTATFFNRKVALISTPTVRGVSRIEKEFLASDRRRYFVPCPECGRFDFLTWSGAGDFLSNEDPGHFRIEWDEDKPETARVVCPGCDARIPERAKTGMLEAGEWRPTAEGPPRVAGFSLSGLYSPLGWRSWAARARLFLEVKDDPVRLRSFVNMALGETFEEKGDSVAPRGILARGENYDDKVPTGVGLLVASADVQNDRIEVKVKGFGAGEESWLLEYETIWGDPGKDSIWMELDAFLLRRRTHENGRELGIDVAVVDSGGAQAERVYRFCGPRTRRRVFPIKGSSTPAQPIVARSSVRNYGAKLFLLGVDTAKELVYSRLAIAPPKIPGTSTPGLMHFPSWISEEPEYAAQLTAEKAVRRWVKGRGSVREWIKLRERNEALDLEVYALAALYILGRGTIASLGERAKKFAKPIGSAESVEAAEAPPTVPRALRHPRSRGWMDWKR